MSFDHLKRPPQNVPKTDKQAKTGSETGAKKSAEMTGAPDPTELGNLVNEWFPQSSDGRGSSVENTAREGASGKPESLPHRQILESSFGADLGQVPFYSGPGALKATDQFQADAYAFQGSIVSSTPSPSLHTMAEETAHVLQQRGGSGGAAGIAGATSGAEMEATAAADTVIAGGSVGGLSQSLGSGMVALARKGKSKKKKKTKKPKKSGTKSTTSPGGGDSAEDPHEKNKQAAAKAIAAADSVLEASSTYSDGLSKRLSSAKRALQSCMKKPGVDTGALGQKISELDAELKTAKQADKAKKALAAAKSAEAGITSSASLNAALKSSKKASSQIKAVKGEYPTSFVALAEEAASLVAGQVSAQHRLTTATQSLNALDAEADPKKLAAAGPQVSQVEASLGTLAAKYPGVEADLMAKVAALNSKIADAKQSLAQKGEQVDPQAAQQHQVTIHAFRGARSKDGVDIKDLPADEQAEIKGKMAQNPLLHAGHVGISVEEGGPIYGLTPDLGDLPLREGVGKLFGPDRVTDGESFPGVVDDDSEVFALAQTLHEEGGFNTQTTTITRNMTPEAHAKLKAQLEELKKKSDMGQPIGMNYSFPKKSPTDQGEFHDPDTFNCATFPRRVGVDIPEQSGRLRDYMPQIEEESRQQKKVAKKSSAPAKKPPQAKSKLGKMTSKAASAESQKQKKKTKKKKKKKK